MRLEIDAGANLWVERDSQRKDCGREGFLVDINGVTLHFADEDDAIKLARMILDREGIKVSDPPPLEDFADDLQRTDAPYGAWNSSGNDAPSVIVEG